MKTFYFVGLYHVFILLKQFQPSLRISKDNYSKKYEKLDLVKYFVFDIDVIATE